MLKTISAALLAVSMIAAPALAADSGSNAQTTANTTTQNGAPAGKTTQTQTNAKVKSIKSNKVGSNAHHPRHKKISLHKSHAKVSSKHVASPTKRG